MYEGLKEIANRYWTAYGGRNAFFRSPYLHLALLLCLVSAHFWLTGAWWEQPLAVIPNLLGFSLGGLAMLLSFGSAEFQKFISGKEPDEAAPTAFMEVPATFVHFMLLQLGALLTATIFKSLDFFLPWPADLRPIVDVLTAVFSGIGYLLFLYSITAMVAAVFAVFRMTSWFEFFQNASQVNEAEGGEKVDQTDRK
ncbi:conserved membrane hypothetical protein [Xanthomonas citri pv. citri]|uniref:hypothetical protein n=1 Tax=Xanthomonas citri TaxID=346 RepID=UPI00052BEC87|nr:hypothetical protein [Xanthomonas citri]ARR16623.1 hypothetical protein B7L65_06535 [Xanthomonas citri pv. citri]ARR22528.1 hypothetical protein B7L67_13980 [Xanthomonas citri pv. citri]CEE67314.1 conserved membrane hypothetical protein [Xanthomonas citri pv. citri]CEE82114.1 conserved membrane hypothetical protein [Xanthomonas citri pv. citri]CEH83301.1 conserved membrane hypothetical protein [Xanthomonas citri pv. citri]